jgi:hypothetical protein
MSWKTAKDKERFFDELDRAFNTPVSETLVLPKADKDDALNDIPSSTGGRKRKSPNAEENDVKRRRASAPGDSLTGVGIRPAKAERLKPRRSSTSSKKNLTPTRSSENLKQDQLSDLLEGMVLFFIPNSRKNGVRRFRMNLFGQHGAEVRDVWSEEITHVICDNNITGERLLRALRWEQIPVRFIVIYLI